MGALLSGGGYGFYDPPDGYQPGLGDRCGYLPSDAKGNVQISIMRQDARCRPIAGACRGSGGGNYGIINMFYCDTLPAAPKEKLTGGISFDWANMTPERFYRILYLYSNYFDTRGRDADTWGLFTILGMSPVNLSSPNPGRFDMEVQFTNPDGTAQDSKVLERVSRSSTSANRSPNLRITQVRQTPTACRTPTGPAVSSAWRSIMPCSARSSARLAALRPPSMPGVHNAAKQSHPPRAQLRAEVQVGLYEEALHQRRGNRSLQVHDRWQPVRTGR